MVNMKGAEIPTTGRVVHYVVFDAAGNRAHRTAFVTECTEKEELRCTLHVFTMPGDRLPDTGRNLPGPVELVENVRPYPSADNTPANTWHWPERQ